MPESGQVRAWVQAPEQGLGEPGPEQPEVPEERVAGSEWAFVVEAVWLVDSTLEPAGREADSRVSRLEAEDSSRVRLGIEYRGRADTWVDNMVG